MNISNIRKQILEEFLKNIGRLADEKYQERVWVRAEGPECNDIDDAICDFFDDGDPILEKYKDYEITISQLENIIKLYAKLRFFTDTYGVYWEYKSTAKLIKMPEWEEIRILARNVLQAFNFH